MLHQTGAEPTEALRDEGPQEDLHQHQHPRLPRRQLYPRMLLGIRGDLPLRLPQG